LISGLSLQDQLGTLFGYKEVVERTTKAQHDTLDVKIEQVLAQIKEAEALGVPTDMPFDNLELARAQHAQAMHDGPSGQRGNNNVEASGSSDSPRNNHHKRKFKASPSPMGLRTPNRDGHRSSFAIKLN